jgi:hypothetical protein
MLTPKKEGACRLKLRNHRWDGWALTVFDGAGEQQHCRQGLTQLGLNDIRIICGISARGPGVFKPDQFPSYPKLFEIEPFKSIEMTHFVNNSLWLVGL